MPPKKKKKEPFTSMRILSERAQHLWSSARKKMKHAEGDDAAGATLPKREELPEVVARISIPSVVKATFAILAIVIGVMLVFALRDKFVILLLSMFLALVIDPAVRFMERWSLPRGLAIILVYLCVLALAIFLIASLIPIVVSQIRDLAQLLEETADDFLASPRIDVPFLPEGVNQILTTLTQRTLEDLEIGDLATALGNIEQGVSTAGQSVINLAVGLAGSTLNFIINLVLVLVLAFFIQMEKEKIFEYVRVLFPRTMRPYFDTKSEAIHEKVGQWIRGEILLGLAVGSLVFIAMYIVGLGEYALTLAILAGFLEFIPVAGPIIASIPAILIAGTQYGLTWALVVAGVYYVIQWCENNLLIPLIMKRTVGLSPIAILFAMLVGISFPQTIHPILGIILSVPTTAIITLFIRDIQEARRRE